MEHQPSVGYYVGFNRNRYGDRENKKRISSIIELCFPKCINSFSAIVFKVHHPHPLLSIKQLAAVASSKNFFLLLALLLCLNIKSLRLLRWPVCSTNVVPFSPILKENPSQKSSERDYWGSWRIRTAVHGFADRWLSHSSKEPIFLVCGCKGSHFFETTNY